MVDIIGSISGAVTSIKTATEIAKFIRDSGVSLEQAEVKLKLADLMSVLADAKMDVATTQQALIEKDSQIQALQKKLEIQGHIDYRDPSYWLKTETGDDGPFCQQCYDTDKKLIHLQPSSSVSGSWTCKTCKNGYRDQATRVRDDVRFR